jgi:hypothetical protein
MSGYEAPSWGVPLGRIWYVSDAGQEYGPYTQQEIAGLVAGGQVSVAALVWREGLAAWFPVAGILAPAYVPTVAAPAYVPPSYQAPKRRLTYFQRCGTRCVIFQFICLGWTAMIGCWAFATMMNIAHQQRTDPQFMYDSEAAGLALGMSWFCLFGAWLLVGLPTGIAAIATYEGGKGR